MKEKLEQLLEDSRRIWIGSNCWTENEMNLHILLEKRILELIEELK